jgi:hypothetical protein
MSTKIIKLCGTTLLGFSKNDPVLTRVPGATPSLTVKEKVNSLFYLLFSKSFLSDFINALTGIGSKGK